MSMIHSSWFPLGARASESAGTAKLSTVLSTEISRTGNMSTARAAQRRRCMEPVFVCGLWRLRRGVLMGICFLERYMRVDNNNCTVRTVQFQRDDAYRKG